jgi:glycosyltransferase involved in cell wall biosynthesis
VGLSGAPKAAAAAAFVAGALRRAVALKPDVLHCHSLWSPALAGALASRLSGAPLCAKPMRGGEATKIAGTPFGRARLAWLARAVDRFVVISREIDQELAGFDVPQARRAFIPNGVDLSRFSPVDPAEKAALRDRLGLPRDRTLVVFAGRMSPQKRLPLLLDAWRTVASAAPDAMLLIASANRDAAGDADDGIDPARLSGPGLRPLGHVSDMPTLLRAADAFALPSASEGLSNALLEACASGLAVVASRTGGATDFLEHGRNGLLFDVDDRKGLEACLAALCADGALRARLGAAARETVSSTYDIRAAAASLLGLYRELRGTA